MRMEKSALSDGSSKINWSHPIPVCRSANAAATALLIGGPDGLDPTLKASADESLRLSDLTLPHAFVRVMLAEALYRAWSVNAGHPYHRE